MIARSVAIGIFVGTTLLALTLPLQVKSQDDDSKAIKAEVFLKERPARTAPSKAKYRRVKSTESVSATPKDGMVAAQMGLTVWRFRPAAESDKTKELVEVDDGQEWVLERIADGTPFSPGQKVRFSIESLSKMGHLYVVNREEYADGTFGDPKLIFPTQKSINNNKVEPGRLIYIPSGNRSFQIQASESAKIHVAESLTIIVSPKPLIDDSQLQPQAIKLQREQFNQWLNQWSAPIVKFEMEGGVGQTLTPMEQAAAKVISPLLSQGDPVPQTIYQMMVKQEAPLLIDLRLRFAK